MLYYFKHVIDKRADEGLRSKALSQALLMKAKKEPLAIHELKLKPCRAPLQLQ